jgi:hypothetical protein
MITAGVRQPEHNPVVTVIEVGHNRSWCAHAELKSTTKTMSAANGTKQSHPGQSNNSSHYEVPCPHLRLVTMKGQDDARTLQVMIRSCSHWPSFNESPVSAKSIIEEASSEPTRG